MIGDDRLQVDLQVLHDFLMHQLYVGNLAIGASAVVLLHFNQLLDGCFKSNSCTSMKQLMTLTVSPTVYARDSCLIYGSSVKLNLVYVARPRQSLNVTYSAIYRQERFHSLLPQRLAASFGAHSTY
jgi:hypothetical protein